ncbi:hypothetical protein GEMRC1_011170 [Eukaryota sp. GEM-RC1]
MSHIQMAKAPFLSSMRSEKIAQFLALYDRYKDAVSEESRLPLRLCVSPSILSVLRLKETEIDTEEQLKEALSSQSKFRSYEEFDSAFKKLRLDPTIDNAADRIYEYTARFLELKERSTLEIPDEAFCHRYINGLNPPTFARSLHQRLKDSIFSDLNQLIETAIEEFEDMQRYLDLAGKSTRQSFNDTKSFQKPYERKSTSSQERATNRALDRKSNACFYCHEPGHVKANCPKLQKKTPYVKVESSNMIIDQNNSSCSSPFLWVPVVLNDKVSSKAIIDTGATFSSITMDLVKAAEMEVKPFTEEYSCANQVKYQTLGSAYSSLSLRLGKLANSVSLSTSLKIIDGFNQILIGTDVLRELGVMTDRTFNLNLDEVFDDDCCDAVPEPPLLANTSQSATPFERGQQALQDVHIDLGDDHFDKSLQKLLLEYADVFDPVLPVEGMDVQPMPLPFKNENERVFKSARRLPPEKLKRAKQILQSYVDQGLARIATGKHQSPVVFITYPNRRPRIAGDYSGVDGINSRLIPITSCLPRISDIQAQLSSADFIASIDLPSAFYQLPIKEEDIPKTAIAVPGLSIEFTRASFGISNVPTYFQNVMSSLFSSDSTSVYIDDLICTGTKFEDFLECIRRTLQIARSKRIRFAAHKCKFVHKGIEIKVLGSVFKNNKKSIDDSRIEALVELSPPRTVSELRSIIGAFNYVREFIPNFATLTKPFHELTKKNTRFKWSDACQKSFDELKSSVLARVELSLPDGEGNLFVTVDASDEAMGGAIWKELSPSDSSTPFSKRNVAPVSFFSKSFSNTQRKFSTFQKEFLAFVTLLSQRNVSSYLKGQKFTWLTDHRNLTFVLDVEPSNHVIERWRPFLAQFSFDIQHIPGKENVWADLFSRIFPPTTTAQVNLLSGDFEKLHETGSLVPENLRQQILEDTHCSPLSGHPSKEDTIRKIVNAGLTWPSLKEDVSSFVDKCQTFIKTANIKRCKPKLSGTLFTQRPFETLSADVMGQFPKDNDGNAYLFVFVDNFSRYTILAPVTDITAASAANVFLKNIFLHFGLPRSIHSDNGKEFANQILKNLFETLNIEQTFSVPYSHESNGLVERRNRDVLSILRKLLLTYKNYDNWSSLIPSVQLILNSRYHSTTKTTPFSLIFGSDITP